MNGEIALGLMSGTSADGVSAALATFKAHSFKFIGVVHVPYPDEVVRKIRAGGNLSVREASALNVEIGEVFAQAANKVMKKTHTDPNHVACIGSHGQTVYHGPRDTPRNTLQLGDPAVIAERTGVTVVSNFHQRDVAAGGEGAPLMPFFDQFFFGGGPVRAMQNIGGIGNVTIVGRGIDVPLAFDTGPGNGLMDEAMREITGGAEQFDNHGQRAKKGTMSMDAVERMIKHDYFQRPPPKSTGLETFGREFLLSNVGDLLREKPDDAMASLNYLTCLSIQESYRRFIFPKFEVEEVVVSGGGAHNRTLMKKLECLFAPIPVKTIEDFDLPAQAKEPVAFAFFALRCLHGKINHLPSGTGASGARILGSITPGPSSGGH
ncbi:MAG: anhydro-N-acetylmuramic acid kinase [Elusimicrobia bacterium]|nr:anhydro-N-acetylmuramic acid kinase [Elusimicrobiota bacterium]